jgi:hypothetical protein
VRVGGPEFDAVAPQEVGDQRSRSSELGHFGPRLHRVGHPRVDLDLQVKVGCVMRFGFGESVQEIVEQEEVVEEVFEGQRRGWSG